jgi:periplasmic divalent cation tolerance protein
MTDGSPLWILLTTVAAQEHGIQLARQLVEEHWVACAQVLPPMQSIYVWQGSLCQETECLVLFKIPHHLYERAEQRIRALHPYQEPEIIGLAAEKVSVGYLTWILEQTRKSADPAD